MHCRTKGCSPISNRASAARKGRAQTFALRNMTMKTKHEMILWVAVLLLIVHSAYLTRRLSAMSDRLHVGTLTVENINLVQPSGSIVGNIRAGGNDGTPEINLKQEGRGHNVRLGFDPNGGGPCIKLNSGYRIGQGYDAEVEVGAFQPWQCGIRVTGGKDETMSPITLSWITDGARTNANRYWCSLPESKAR
jgi:hypothetical protein